MEEDEDGDFGVLLDFRVEVSGEVVAVCEVEGLCLDGLVLEGVHVDGL